MAANNQVVIIGRAGNNVSEDTKTLQSGSVVAEVRLAVNRPGKDSMGNSVTDWLTCKFWNKQAEILSQYVHKGDLISVSGSMRVDNWETPSGEKRKIYFIHGENFQMLESRRAKEERVQMERSGGGGGYSAPAPAPAPAPSAKAAPVDNFADDDFALDDDELPPF